MKIEFSEEEQAENNRIGKNYQIQCMRRTNHDAKDMTNKIWLQQEAIRAMPADLRAATEVIDETPPPKNRPFPVWLTPPIKNFNVYEYIKKDEDENENSDKY